ncbi:MAG: class B sortase [Eubacterium sp.]|nr:class B sortase [Eubacterium sp.]
MAENEVARPEEEEQEEKKKRRPLAILLIFLGVLLLIGGAVYTGIYLYSVFEPEPEPPTVATTAATEGTTVDNRVENPIDFAALQAENDEQYAWIKVPGTNVDYPICQSRTDDEFYLKHKASDKTWSEPGAVFTQRHNSLDFTDRVTLVYGHNGYSDKMFATLHYFDKEDFFNEHEVFYIYTPTSIKTYEIISVFKYDDRHIMNSFDFQNDEVFLDFLNMIRQPDSTLVHTRDSFTQELTTDDRVVILSTCIWRQNGVRFLVCGVLINDEETY